MERQHTALIVANALIWMAVLLGTGLILSGTPHFRTIGTLVAGGAAASVIVVGGGIGRLSN